MLKRSVIATALGDQGRRERINRRIYVAREPPPHSALGPDRISPRYRIVVDHE